MDQFANYVRDLGRFVREMALESKQLRDAARGTDDEAFRAGHLMALHEVVSLMQQQAVAFQIPLEAISLADIEPENHLL